LTVAEVEVVKSFCTRREKDKIHPTITNLLYSFFLDLRKIASMKRTYLCDRQGKADTSRPRREGPPLAGRCICHPA